MDKKQEKIISWFRDRKKSIRNSLDFSEKIPNGDIDDLAEEVFSRLSHYTDEVLVESPQAHLFRITANVANDWKKRIRNHRAHDAEAFEHRKTLKGEEEDFSRSMKEKLQKEISDLPPEQREALLLHVNEGLTYWQIAEKCGSTPGVVLKNLCRAYSTLRMNIQFHDRVLH